MPIRKYSKTTSDQLFISNISNHIDPLDIINSFDHGDLDAVSIDYTAGTGNAEADIDQVMASFGYEPLGNEPNVLVGTHNLGKFPTANEPTMMNAREGDSGYDTDRQSGSEYNGHNWNNSSLRSIEPFGGFGPISNALNEPEEFDDPLWTDPSGFTTVTPNDALAPNGLMVADKIEWTSVGLGLRQVSLAVDALTAYALSFWGESVSDNDTLEFALNGGSTVTVTVETGVLRRYFVPLTSGNSGTGNFDVSVTGTVGTFRLWGMNLSKGSVITPYLNTRYAPVPDFIPGMVVNESLLMSKGDIIPVDENPVTVKHLDTADDTQPPFAISNEGTNSGISRFFPTDRDPTGNITPIGAGDFALRSNGANSEIYQARGATSADWKRLAFSSEIGGTSLASFSSDTDTDTLGNDKGIFACTDTTVQRTLTISNTTIAVGTAANPHRFTVKDESGLIESSGYGIRIVSESGDIDGVISASISRNFGSLSFYTDGTNVFIEKEYTPPVSNISATANFFSFLGQTVQAGTSFAFNNDGTKMFFLDTLGNIFEYTLVIPYVTSASNVTYAFKTALLAGDNAMMTLSFNNDGTKLFTGGSQNDNLYEYTFNSGAFDLATGVTAGPSADISGFEASITTMAWNSDGTKVFVAGGNSFIYECTVNSGAFDLTTGVTQTQSFAVTASTHSLNFTDDGRRFFTFVGNANNEVRQYDLTTPFSVASGVTFSGFTFIDGALTATGRSMSFNSIGSRMYLQVSNNLVYEYKVFPDFSLRGTGIDVEQDTALRVPFANTTNTGVLGTREIYACTDTSAARTLTISSSTIALGSPGIVLEFMVKDESGGAGSNSITIDTEGAETIDGVASVDITVNFGFLKFYTDGSNVFINGG